VVRAVAGFDIGQTVVVASQACVAVEAMEGTDAAIERAGEIMRTLETDESMAADNASFLARSLTVVKVAKPKQDMRFDVPVVGLATIETMERARATCLSLEAGRTLIFDRDTVLARADAAGIAIVATERG
jgi:UDP-2,3-diacylglucosamine hydrolase